MRNKLIRKAAEILNEVELKGNYKIEVGSPVKEEQLLADELTSLGVLVRMFVKNFPEKSDFYQYSPGSNFDKAVAMGAESFLNLERKYKYAPTIKMEWNRISEKGMFMGLVGFILVKC